MVVTDLKHIYWRSRRGMLELELQLIPFVRDHFSSLTEREQRCYEQMLDLEDWQLFDWVQGRETPADPLVRQVVEKIIATPAAMARLGECWRSRRAACIVTATEEDLESLRIPGRSVRARGAEARFE